MQVSAGKGGTVFDEDPKRWRLIAEGFTTTGRALEIATAVWPQNFVLLAGVLYRHNAVYSLCYLLKYGIMLYTHCVICSVTMVISG